MGSEMKEHPTQNPNKWLKKKPQKRPANRPQSTNTRGNHD